jgi:hypothetical protein
MEIFLREYLHKFDIWNNAKIDFLGWIVFRYEVEEWSQWLKRFYRVII